MVVVYVRAFPTREANSIVMNVLEARYSDLITAHVPEGSVVTCSAGGPGWREAVRIEHAGGGYDGGDPEGAAEWAIKVVMDGWGCCVPSPSRIWSSRYRQRSQANRWRQPMTSTTTRWSERRARRDSTLRARFSGHGDRTRPAVLIARNGRCRADAEPAFGYIERRGSRRWLSDACSVHGGGGWPRTRSTNRRGPRWPALLVCDGFGD
jgi:hypothetical protein